MPEIKKAGTIWYDEETSCYIDQLNLLEDVKVYRRQFKSYVKSTYNMTLEEYYNLVVHGDKSRIQLCPICGRKLEFGTLLYPYKQSCEVCRKSYNFRSNEDVQNYCSAVNIPSYVTPDQLRSFINFRTSFLFKIFKGSGDNSDLIMTEGKKTNSVKMSTIRDMINKGYLNSRYSNRKNVYDYLINKGFYPYELQYIIVDG